MKLNTTILDSEKAASNNVTAVVIDHSPFPLAEHLRVVAELKARTSPPL